MSDTSSPLGWIGILRLGLVQTALGAIVVLTTSTMNRVMVVELALPAMLPGVLVALHYAIQILRPRLGHQSDVGGRRTPWIIGGMLVLALGGIGAAFATAWMGLNLVAGIALAVASFLLIGVGVGAAGISLLVLLAKRSGAQRRAQAATVMWVMMIAGFVVTGGIAGHFLDPFTSARLIGVTTVVACSAVVLAMLAVWGIEEPAAAQQNGGVEAAPVVASTENRKSFSAALAEVWNDQEARRFTVFVFVSMLAYSAQDLILEPFAGLVFGMTPGQSTQLSGLQNAGVLAGMIILALTSGLLGGARRGSLRVWIVGGCLGSAAALISLAFGGFEAGSWPIQVSVAGLGFANGIFAVAAIASMMELAGAGTPGREGVRMGVWGAAQAIAFGLGGFLGTVAIDAMRLLVASPVMAYAVVFIAEALLFCFAARLAYRTPATAARTPSPARIATAQVASS